MNGLSKQRTLIAIIIVLISGLVTGITKGWFGPDKVKVINFPPNQKDTVIILQPGDSKNDTGLGKSGKGEKPQVEIPHTSDNSGKTITIAPLQEKNNDRIKDESTEKNIVAKSPPRQVFQKNNTPWLVFSSTNHINYKTPFLYLKLTTNKWLVKIQTPTMA